MTLRNALAAMILTAGAIVLAGCGKQALLARPAPLIGPRTQPSPEAATRDAMTRRALADAAPYAPPRAPLSLNEMRRVETRRGAAPKGAHRRGRACEPSRRERPSNGNPRAASARRRRLHRERYRKPPPRRCSR